jgi:ornithine cyclodeaminase/alanine dehydrogenase-like protein (mu-crystallin family)
MTEMDDRLQEADSLVRQILPIEGTFRLDKDPQDGSEFHPERQVARVINKFGNEPFISDLADEIEAMYIEPGIRRSDRTRFAEVGGESGFATWELMAGQGSDYTVYKHIGSDPDNRRHGLMTVWGQLVCIESATNHTRLICGAGHLTTLRTATTTASVLRVLKPEMQTLGVIGTGMQGQTHALSSVVLSPTINTIFLRDKYFLRAKEAEADIRGTIKAVLGEGRANDIKIEAVVKNDKRLETESDAIITATSGLPTQPPALTAAEELKPNVVVAAIGADMVGKRELDPSIYDLAKFVTDEFAQSLREGELQHAAKRIGITRQNIAHRDNSGFHGSLHDGRVIGITELLTDPDAFARRPEPITIYDSTGFAGQDLAVTRLFLRVLLEGGYEQDSPFNGPSDPEQRSLRGLLGLGKSEE